MFVDYENFMGDIDKYINRIVRVTESAANGNEIIGILNGIVIVNEESPCMVQFHLQGLPVQEFPKDHVLVSLYTNTISHSI